MAEATIAARETARTDLSGGFWKRAIALIIDLCTVGALAIAIAIVGFSATDGAVRMQDAIARMTLCEATDLRPHTLDMPNDFRVDNAVVCTTSFFGLTIDRFVRVSQIDRRENGSTAHTLIASVGPDGDTGPFVFLDGLDDIMMLLGLMMSEALLGTTFGKWCMGLKVVDVRTGQRSVRGAVIRNGTLFGGAALIAVYNFALGLFPESLGGVGFAVLAIAIVWIVAPIIAMIFQRPDPFYDRIAGTRVVAR